MGNFPGLTLDTQNIRNSPTYSGTSFLGAIGLRPLRKAGTPIRKAGGGGGHTSFAANCCGGKYLYGFSL